MDQGERISDAVNRTPVPQSMGQPINKCIHKLFEAQVEQTPDAIALVLEDQQLTYDELNQRANQLAHLLVNLGVDQTDQVGLAMHRSLELIIGLLAILKAGGMYVPLDPAYPQQRLRSMIEDSNVSFILTRQYLQSRFTDNPVRLFCLDTVWEDLSQQSKKNPSRMFSGGEIACILYTSGSTGLPKGVMLPHRAIVNHASVLKEKYNLQAADRVLQFASISFDISLEELFPSWGNGAAVVLWPPDTAAADLAGFMRVLKEQALTVLNLPTAYWHEWVEQLEIPGMVPSAPLRLVVVGGEKALPEKFACWYKYVPAPMRWINVYGPTETTVATTTYEPTLAQNEGSSSAPVPIGKPIANTYIYLLDRDLQFVPSGEVGEIYIGGAGLAHGYLHRPDLTAERFVPDPFTKQNGSRLYRTGDYARYRVDGLLEFVGRADQQVKIRGYRIEPGEIEAVLAQMPAVQYTIVTARENMMRESRLVAYVVPRPGQIPTSKHFRDYLKERLPEYMIPSVFVLLETLPLTPNGKVDHRALPEPDWARPEQERSFVAPRTALERIIAGIWAEILGLEQVGIFDDFFELGGHSLVALRIISRLRQTFHKELPLHSFFHAPRVADLARLIEEAGGTGEEDWSFPPIQAVSRERELPLSFPQERVWFLHQMYSDNLSYHTQTTYTLSGLLNVAALEQCINEIVRRHEILRTTFTNRDGRAVQVIHQAQPMPLPVIDLQALPASQGEGEVQRRIYEEVRKLFDPEYLPLIRWTLLRLSTLRHVLVLVEHHLVHDGWSANTLLKELLELYRAFSAGKPSPLPEPSLQFADFACWQRQWMQGEVAEALLAYWKKKLAGSLPVLELPTDHPRPPVQSFQGATLKRALSPDLFASLKILCQQEEVTLFMGMLTAFFVLLFRYSGQEDLCVGSGVASRRWRETEGLLGMLVNNVVLRADLSGNPSFRQLLQRVREVTLEAYEHEDLPFDWLVKALQPVRLVNYNPLFQVIFSFHDSAKPDLDLPGLHVDMDEGLGNGSAKFDLNVIVIPAGGRKSRQHLNSKTEETLLLWEYCTDLFDEMTIVRMAAHYQTLLASIVAHPEWRLSELLFVTETERQQLLGEWNDTWTQYPANQCIHQLFEAHAERSSETTALLFGEERYTYTLLNQKANRLAHYLRRRGVQVGDLVGLYMERTADLIVATLAILKAGAAYVPLDLAYPQERIAFMVQDTRMQVALTQQSLRDCLPQAKLDVVIVDREQASIALEPQSNLPCETHPQNLAYVIYTSGSTGIPKGVAIPHQAVTRLVCNTSYIQVNPADRIAQLSNTSFDAATFEVWGALLNGAQLVGVPRDIILSPREFAVFCHTEQITIAFLTTALFNQIAQHAPEAFLHMRQVCFGGEAVDPDRVRAVLKNGCPAHLVHVYGPTENTTYSTWYPVEVVSETATTIPIGYPIANSEAYVLDHFLQLLPVGVPGELYLGGDGLAQSYLHRPDLTAERFVPHPFSQRPGARLYNTGDRVRVLPDGAIEFLERLDSQVKLRGFRVELGEIESLLRQYPAVRDAVVLLREDRPGDKRLVAYLVAEQRQTPSLDQVKAHLQAKLPDYMLPSAFVMLEQLPLTPNGKLDRQALPAPDTGHLQPEDRYMPPSNQVERQLVELWAEMLGVEKIGIYDNFFALGGHSLLATQLISRVQKTFQIHLPLRPFFESPTVAGLARSIAAPPQQISPESHPLLTSSRPKRQRTEHLLATLEQLSEQEIDSLLGQMLSESGGNSD